MERLEDIWNLHLEGKSTIEITDWMNQKYEKTLFTNNPYYKELIWVTLDKLKKRKIRLLDIKESYIHVEFLKIEELLKNNDIPRNLRNIDWKNREYIKIE